MDGVVHEFRNRAAVLDHPFSAGGRLVFRVEVDNLHVAFVLEVLVELEREVEATATCVDQLTIGLLDFRSPPLHAMTNLRTAVALTRTKINLLRDRALGHVEAASDVTIQEENLRARLNVILCQVDLLGKRPLAPRMYAGRFAGFNDVRAYLYEQIGRINACWLGEFRVVQANVTDVASVGLLRIALANAHVAVSLIGRDPDLMHFLREGVIARRQSTRTACRELAAIVDADVRSLTPRDSFDADG